MPILSLWANDLPSPARTPLLVLFPWVNLAQIPWKIHDPIPLSLVYVEPPAASVYILIALGFGLKSNIGIVPPTTIGSVVNHQFRSCLDHSDKEICLFMSFPELELFIIRLLR